MTDVTDPQMVGLRRRLRHNQPREMFQLQPGNTGNLNNDGEDAAAIAEADETVDDSFVSEQDVFETTDDSTAPTTNVDNTTTLTGPQQPPAILRARTVAVETALPRGSSRTTTGLGRVPSPNILSSVSCWYCFLSMILLVFALIVTPSQPSHSLSLSASSLRVVLEEDSPQHNENNLSRKLSSPEVTSAQDISNSSKSPRKSIGDSSLGDWTTWIHSNWNWLHGLLFDERAAVPTVEKRGDGKDREETNIEKYQQQINISDKQEDQKPWWARLFGKSHNGGVDARNIDANECKESGRLQSAAAFIGNWAPVEIKAFFQEGQFRKYFRWIDPAILHPTSATTTDIIDKVVKSTPRLLAVANFMLAMAYLLHSAVALWFLGPRHRQGYPFNGRDNSMAGNQQQGVPPGMVVELSPSSNGARERMGGFLVFKLLLISAVVAPDTLDLLILLTWYTWLSCLRSLDHLAHTTTTHLAALGHSPRNGAVKLLFLVLGCDIVAATSCLALFHSAGLDIVLLLTCDCALLAVDVFSHILRFLQCVLEEEHTTSIRGMEARQVELHNAVNRNSDGVLQRQHAEGWFSDDSETGGMVQESQRRSPSAMTNVEVHHESRRIDHQIEAFELSHSRRLAILDFLIFGLDLLCHLLTIAHFCHIWSLHGVQFTLIDGVLALHVHSALSTVCKKIAQRRNMYNIARDLQGHFPNARDEELKKASAAGDVCCICLCTMTSGDHVKKVKCGHLYHTHCLREIVERAQSLQAAKCPLCRASLIDGGNSTFQGSSRVSPDAAAPQQFQMNPATTDNARAEIQRGADERALFRFSTETLLPPWLPIPAFSFEVVRRPSLGAHAEAAPNAAQQVSPARADTGPLQNTETRDVVGAPTVNDGAESRPEQEVAANTSFLRRILLLAGAVSMSPEEEARALAQLVDMFPQYERNDLLRELRARGSSETVVEAILMGVFSGVPRGE